jgi:hypothetical protein
MRGVATELSEDIAATRELVEETALQKLSGLTLN